MISKLTLVKWGNKEKNPTKTNHHTVKKCMTDKGILNSTSSISLSSARDFVIPMALCQGIPQPQAVIKKELDIQ